MQFAYSTPELRSLCENAVLASSEWGAIVASTIRRRMADLQAAITVNDLLAGSPKFFGSGKQELLVIQLGENKCLILAPNLLDKGTFQGGKVKWERVGRVLVSTIRGCDE